MRARNRRNPYFAATRLRDEHDEPLVTLVQPCWDDQMIETAERRRKPKHSSLAEPATAHLEPAEADLSPWKAIAGLIVSLAVLIAALIALCFIVAKLVTGYAV